MTATPHNGKEEDFQLFLSLLDSDRFYGKFRDGAHKVDVADLMRHMVKEEMLRFDGTRLFPERRAYTASYKLSDAEAALYETVTTYVTEEMNRADRLQDGVRIRSPLRVHWWEISADEAEDGEMHFSAASKRCAAFAWKQIASELWCIQKQSVG
jgi:hypothetical protein